MNELKRGVYYSPSEVDSDTFVKLNHPLIYNSAALGKKKYGISYEDALSMCYEAFWRAYQKFDPTIGDGKGKTFGSYAKKSMLNSLIDEFNKRKRIDSSIKFVSLDTSSPLNDYPEYNTKEFNSEDYYYNVGENKSLYDDKEIERIEKIDFIKSLIIDLPDKHRKVVCLHSEGYTQKEIAEKLQITQPAVSNILAEAIAHCRRLIVRIELKKNH